MEKLHAIKPNIPWNRGKLVGQKPPLQLQELWAIRVRFQLAEKIRDLALFDLTIDNKLRAYDLVKIQTKNFFARRVISAKAGIQSCNLNKVIE